MDIYLCNFDERSCIITRRLIEALSRRYHYYYR